MAIKRRDFGGPDWSQGKCRTADTDDFFTESWLEAVVIKNLFCSRCPIAHECLQYAIDHNEQGIWGNTTDAERKSLKRRVERVHCPGCASIEVIDMDGSEICISCGLSWLI